jgi:hypothetical protein
MPTSVKVQKLNAKLSRTRIAAGDFEEANSYLAALSGRRKEVVKRALLFAAIVAYCRPFTQNELGSESRAASKLEVSLSELYSEEELALHETVIELRHKTLAHSEYRHKPVRRVQGNNRGFSIQGRPFDILSQGIPARTLLAMCKKLELHCHHELYEINKEIVCIESAA